MNTIILLYPTLVLAYDMICPDHSQRQFRGHGLCTRRNTYSCLEDVFSPRLTFIESCLDKEDVVRPGKRYVIKGQSTSGDCSADRYQPVPFYKTSGSMCVFLKFKCSEVGQVVGTKGSDIADTTCICDYTEGYAYVTRPFDICNCLSPEDDCSCYEKLCPENQRLSADYECINRNTTSMTKCTRVDKPRKVVSTVSAESTDLNRSETEARYITIRICFTVIMGIFCVFIFLVYTCAINKDIVWPDLTNGVKVVNEKDITMITETELEKLVESKKVYYMKGIKKGKVIIITNVNFPSYPEINGNGDCVDGEKKILQLNKELNILKCRQSVDFDTSVIQQLFRCMKFKCPNPWKKITREEIEQLCETVTKEESYDSLVVVIQSAGQSYDPMEIYDSHGDKVDKEKIFKTIRESPAFKGKPKVVIYTTYNVDDTKTKESPDTIYVSKSKIDWPTSNNEDLFVITAVPTIKHGHWMFGEKMFGSYFIQALTHVFESQAYNKSFRNLLEKVNNCLHKAMVPDYKDCEKGKPTVVAEVKVLEFSNKKNLFFFPTKMKQGLQKAENNDVADLLKQKEDPVRITISNKPKIKNSSDEAVMTVISKMSYGENGDIYKKLDLDPIVLPEGNAIVNEKKPVGASTCEKGKLEDSKPTDFFKWPDLVHGCSFKKKHFVKATPDQYETILKEGKQVYDMIKDTKKGMVIWISNIACPDKSKGNIEEKRIIECRNNCDFDKTNMEQLLKAMGLECRPKDQLKDATGEEITQFVKKRLDEVDKDKTNKYASLLVMLMSGKVECRSDKIYDKDGKVVERSHLYDIFKKSQHFKEKPKIVIIQSYNFEKETLYDTPDGSRNEMIDAEGLNNDDLFVVSTYPRIEKGPWMVGNNLNGSYFIQAMIHVFKSHSHNKSFLELLQKVQQCLQTALVPELKDEKYDEEGQPTRVADVVLQKYSEGKELFFFPALNKENVKLLNDFSSSVKGDPVTQPVDDTIKSTDEIAKDLQKPVSNFSEQNAAQTYEKTDSLPPDNQAATDTKSSLESPIVQISSESKAEQTFPQTYEKSDTVSPGDPAGTQLLVDTGAQLLKE